MTNTAQAILDYLKSYPPNAQIAERKELDGLGTSQEIDEALLELQDAHVLGSPAPKYWMTLRPWTDRGNMPRWAPPAALPDLLRSTLERQGIGIRPSQGELEYAAALEQGDYSPGVLNYENVGTDRYFPLVLRWGYGQAVTEYDGECAPTPEITHSDAFGIHDPVAFAADCDELGLYKARIEKDLYVNALLRAVGDWNEQYAPDLVVTVALGGGTCLTKGGIFSQRFSEDVDLVVLERGHDPALLLDHVRVDTVTASLQAYIGAALVAVPGFRYDKTIRDSEYPVIALTFRYRTPWWDAAGPPGVPRLILKLDFGPPAGLYAAGYDIPWPVRNVPNPFGLPDTQITWMPKVSVPYILAGKLLAIGEAVRNRMAGNENPPR